MTAVPPPPGDPGYEAPTGKVRLRGRIALRLAVIFGVIGIGLIVTGVLVLTSSPFGKVSGFERVSIASGSGAVHLGSGDYLAYYEADGLDVDHDPAPDLTVVLTSPAGATMTLDDLYGASTTTIEKLTYQTDGHDGAALYEFHLAHAGTYRVRVTANSPVPRDADIAFGRSIAGGLVTGVLFLLPGILLFVAAIVLLIVGLVRRSRHKAYLAAYPPGSPPPYHPPPGSPRYRGVG